MLVDRSGSTASAASAESLEQAIDSCETAAHVLEGIALQAS